MTVRNRCLLELRMHRMTGCNASKATLNKSLVARASCSRAVCGVAKTRRAARPVCVLRLAAHPDCRRPHPRGLVQRRPKPNLTPSPEVPQPE